MEILYRNLMIIDYQDMHTFRSIKDIFELELPTKFWYPVRFQYRVRIELPISKQEDREIL